MRVEGSVVNFGSIYNKRSFSESHMDEELVLLARNEEELVCPDTVGSVADTRVRNNQRATWVTEYPWLLIPHWPPRRKGIRAQLTLSGVRADALLPRLCKWSYGPKSAFPPGKLWPIADVVTSSRATKSTRSRSSVLRNRP